jgi:hypothetical protein
VARGRLISRTLGSSRKFAALHQAAGKLAEFAQTLYPLLIACSDDFGRQAGDAFTVKLVAFPSSPRKEPEFTRALAAMASVGLIRWYEVEGGQVIEIVEFDEHQPNLHKRTASKFPQPSGKVPETPGDSVLREQNLTELKGTQPKRTELRERFERFWEIYPKKVGKDAAWVEFQRRNPGDDLTDDMIAVIQQQRASEQWRKDGGQFIPHPRTWLHQGRWQDEGQKSKAPGEFWADECKRIHNGTCEKRWNHEMKKRDTA